MPTAVRSHAKINLGLGIGAPRADGFHALTTVYQTLELHDIVTVTAQTRGNAAIRLTSNDSRVPADSRNTAWKMVALALDALGITAEVEIHIEKQLPVQGGLGAGSANAVAALVGMEVELGVGNAVRALPPIEPKALDGWGTHGEVERGRTANPGDADPSTPLCFAPDDKRNWGARRLEIAAQVGSDVPLFLIGGAVLGLDRGQEVYPLPDFEPVWCVVATPEIGVSTPQAFRDWDALCPAEGLTPEASHAKLNELSRAYASAFAGAIPVRDSRKQAPSVSFRSSNLERTLPDLKSPRLSAPGSLAGFRTTLNVSSFPSIPPLQKSSAFLRASGTPEAALHASLSGSGSALFGLYLSRGDAEAARERLRPAGVASHLTRTLPRPAYWREMLSQLQLTAEPLSEETRASAAVLGDRLMVGQCPLEAFVQVRILVAQPNFRDGQGSGTGGFY